MTTELLPRLYAVNDYYFTIQGEGVMTGVPMVFLRLMGCSVGCPWCDTKETWTPEAQHEVDTLVSGEGTTGQWKRMSAVDIATLLTNEFPTAQWVCVTGGEPAEQQLHELVKKLHDYGLRCALETSGTALGFIGAHFDHVCVSPKIDMPGGKAVLSQALAQADEIKHVVGVQADVVKLLTLLHREDVTLKDNVTICLQPVSQSKKATELCVKNCQQRGWRLSAQLHKYINLP
jgi:7-carboxy-7-deazaguanine synthase